MTIDPGTIVQAVQLELDPNGPGGALERVDIILRADDSCATVAYTIPGWFKPHDGQTAEEARTNITEHPFSRGFKGWADLVARRTDFEIQNGKLIRRWEWQIEPTDDQRAASYREHDHTV